MDLLVLLRFRTFPFEDRATSGVTSGQRPMEWSASSFFQKEKSADSVCKQLSNLGKKIVRVLQPVFTSRKIPEDLKVTETKPSLVNQQCVVYEFQCNSCDSNYIGCTSRQLHLRNEEHKYSVIAKHLKYKHNQRPTNLHEQLNTLEKCGGKFECLIYEVLLIRKKRPPLNTKNDSIPVKLFIENFSHSCVYSHHIYSNAFSHLLFSI